MDTDDITPETAAEVAREAILTIAMLRNSLKSQATELQTNLRAEIRQAGVTFRAEADSAGATLRSTMEEVIARADRTTQALSVAQTTFLAQRRRLYVGFGVVVMLCLATLVATYSMLYGYYQNRFIQLKSQVAYLDAINRSDVAPCGDGRLCARVDDKAPRLGEKKEYRVVELRQ